MSQCFGGIHIKEEIDDDDYTVEEEEATATVDYSNYTIKIECQEEYDLMSVQDVSFEYPDKTEYSDAEGLPKPLQPSSLLQEQAEPVADSLYNVVGKRKKAILKRDSIHAAKPKKTVRGVGPSEKQPLGRSKRQPQSRSEDQFPNRSKRETPSRSKKLTRSQSKRQPPSRSEKTSSSRSEDQLPNRSKKKTLGRSEKQPRSRSKRQPPSRSEKTSSSRSEDPLPYRSKKQPVSLSKKRPASRFRSEKQRPSRSETQHPSRSGKTSSSRPKRQSPNTKDWKSCDTCGYLTVHKSSIANHIETHFPPDERSIKCSYPDCSYSCARKQFMKSHLANKHQETQHMKKCPLCGYATGLTNQLKRHMATHSETNVYQCRYPGCLFESALRPQLNIHLATAHNETEHLKKCTECGFVAGSDSLLKRHEATHVKPFQCGYPDCGYSGTRKEHLYAHLAVKHGELEHLKKCPHCDFTTGWSDKLKRHLQTHQQPSDRRFQCSFVGCGFGASERLQLNGHYAREHGEERYLKKCTECDYTTLRNGDLKRHLLNHSANRDMEIEILIK